MLSHSLARLSARLPPSSNRLPTIWVSRPAELPDKAKAGGEDADPAAPAAGEVEGTPPTEQAKPEDPTPGRGKRKRNLTAAGPNYALARAIASAERVRDACLTRMAAEPAEPPAAVPASAAALSA